MRNYNLSQFTRGWVCGWFKNSIYQTDQFEICVKRFKAGEKEAKHYHTKTIETTIVIYGRVRMNGREFEQDEIIVIEPNEPSDFEALTDCCTVAYRNGSFPGDKYLVEEK